MKLYKDAGKNENAPYMAVPKVYGGEAFLIEPTEITKQDLIDILSDEHLTPEWVEQKADEIISKLKMQ